MSPSEIASDIVLLFKTLGRDWSGYGEPNKVDCEAAVFAMYDHLQAYEGAVAMELPNTSIKLDRDEDGVYTVFFRVGQLEVIDEKVTD